MAELPQFMDRFFKSKFYRHRRKQDSLIFEVWRRRHALETATFEDIYQAVWEQNPESVHAYENFQANLTRANVVLKGFADNDAWAGQLPFYARIKPAKVSTAKKPTIGYEVCAVKDARRQNNADIFWHRYLNDPRPPLIISTEPLFFFHKELRCYIRFLDISADLSDTEKLTHQIDGYKQRLQDVYGHALPFLEEILDPKLAEYHYQPSGEVLSAIQIEEWFRKHPIPSERQSQKWAVRTLSRMVVDYDTRSSITLGNARTNHYIRNFQDRNKRLPIVLTDTAIDITGQRKKYIDNQEHVFAVVSRVIGNVDRTVVAANNGRAVQGAVSALLNSDQISLLATNLKIDVEGFGNACEWVQAVYKVYLAEGGDYLNSTLVMAAREGYQWPAEKQ